MRCDSCGFWSTEVEQTLGVRRCNKALELWEASEWDDDFNRVVKEGMDEQLMFVMDGSSYAASLYTRGEFFCAHYSAKGLVKSE